jgi:glycogen synthase
MRVRVLTVGNMYPPHYLGGYELVWQAAVRDLRARGHDVRVLTTGYRRADVGGADGEDVHRELRWYWSDHRFPRLGVREVARLERANAAVLDRHLAAQRPDVVAWWAMGGMSLSLVERVRRRDLPAVGFVLDDWLTYGPVVDQWLARVARPGVRRLAERLTGVPARVDLERAARWVFISRHTRDVARQAHPGLRDVAVAHAGVNSGLFRPAPQREWHGRLLYVGRVDERKGIDTAVEALPRLPAHATLTVEASGDDGSLARLRERARELGVQDRVEFVVGRPRDELPGVFAAHDAVLFPARWEEPWGLVPLEAMACGRPVVATGTGGSSEFLEDGRNCLLFAGGDAAGLAAQVERLAADPELRARLRAGGLETAGAHTEDKYADAVEAELERAVQPRAAASQAARKSGASDWEK